MVDLSIVIQQYAGCLKNRQLLFALLNDLFPNDKQMAQCVVFAYDAGVLEEIKSVSHMDTLRIVALANKIIGNYGMQAPLAYSAIYLWLDAFGITYEKISDQTPKKENKSAKPSVGMVLQAEVTAVLDSVLIMDIGYPGERAVLLKREWNAYNPTSSLSARVGDRKKVIVRSFDNTGKYPFWLLSTQLPKEDPWENFIKSTAEGSIFTGRVDQIMQYGFFVNIFDDIVGFVHRSEYGVCDHFTEGQTVDVYIRNIDKERKRISLGLLK